MGQSLKLLLDEAVRDGAFGDDKVRADTALEALVDIADATTGAANGAAWELFVAGAVGNYLTGATGRPPPSSRERAFEMWETPHKANALRAFTSIFPRVGEMSLHDIMGDMWRHRQSARSLRAALGPTMRRGTPRWRGRRRWRATRRSASSTASATMER